MQVCIPRDMSLDPATQGLHQLEVAIRSSPLDKGPPRHREINANGILVSLTSGKRAAYCVPQFLLPWKWYHTPEIAAWHVPFAPAPDLYADLRSQDNYFES